MGNVLCSMDPLSLSYDPGLSLLDARHRGLIDRRVVSLCRKWEEDAVDLITELYCQFQDPAMRFLFGAQPKEDIVRLYAAWIVGNAYNYGLVWGVVEDGILKSVICLRPPHSSDKSGFTDLAIWFWQKNNNLENEFHFPDDETRERFDALQTESEKMYNSHLSSLGLHWSVQLIGTDAKVPCAVC